MATCRCSVWSKARYTMPKPPSPSTRMISNSPRREPVGNALPTASCSPLEVWVIAACPVSFWSSKPSASPLRAAQGASSNAAPASVKREDSAAPRAGLACLRFLGRRRRRRRGRGRVELDLREVAEVVLPVVRLGRRIEVVLRVLPGLLRVGDLLAGLLDRQV